MDLLSRIAGWLGENEATISAVVGIAALTGIVLAGLRTLAWRGGNASQEEALAGRADALLDSDSPARDLDLLDIPGFAGRPALAILPFDNLSDDPDQEYFADGFADELITLLSARREFAVIARHSSFTYKGKAVDVKQVGRELGARYVVEGSVRRSEDRIRITAQLIDATSGEHVWAETYDRNLRDIFTVQDEIAGAVSCSISNVLVESETRRATRKTPQNFVAYDYQMRGLWHVFKFTKEDNRKARALLERAVELDPEYAPAFGDLSFAHYLDNVGQWTDSPARSLAEQVRAAEKCVKLDNTNPWGHWSLAWVHSLTGQRDQAIAAAKLAVELLPSFAAGHQALGLFLSWTGRPDEGIAHQEEAIRLAPRSLLTSYCLHCISLGHFAAGRYEEAVEWQQRALQRNPDYWISLGTLASSQAHIGRLEEARSALEKMLRANPDYSEDGFRMIFSFADADCVERWLRGIRKAGWEEKP